MKKYLLLGIFCFCAGFAARAQLQKGSKYLGATVSFNGRYTHANGSNSGLRTNGFSVDPALQAGIFIKNNVMTGIGIGSSVNISKSRYDDGSANHAIHTSQNSFSLSPFIRHYKTLHPRWAVFLNTSAELAFLRGRNKGITFKDVENGFSAGIRVVPGIAYWVTPRFAIESDISLLSLESGYKDFQKTKSIYFRSGLSSNLKGYFSVRASWYFQKTQ
jgi:hypothetical protein